MATVYDVAKQAGVSIATVSRVFNKIGSVSKATQEKVRKAAESLNYTPHLGARSLMIKRTDTIGVVLPDMHGEFFSELVRGIDVTARELGLHILVSCSHDDLDEMAAVLAAMHGRVDGMVIMSPLISMEALEKHIPSELSVVILNGNGVDSVFPKVSLNNYDGAYQMTEHLIEQGFKDICIIAGPSKNIDAEQRRLGCISAMNDKLGLDQVDIVDGHFSEESGYLAGKNIVARDSLPQAIFALNDAMAIGCLCAFNEASILVPRDIALAGFDDIPLSKYLHPSLSTVHVPIAELGSKAIKVLMSKLPCENPEKIANEHIVNPSLMIRDSSRRNDA